MSDVGLDFLDDDPPEKGGDSNPKNTAEDGTNPKKAEPLDAMGHALGALPESVQLRIATISARYGIDPKADPMYAAVETLELGKQCALAASDGATAAGQAAKAVQASVSQISDQIFSGAVKAGGEVKGELVQGAKLFVAAFVDAAGKQQTALAAAGSTQQAAILDAANIGADKIKNAASTLTSSLDKAIEAKKGEGVSEFAKAAATAANAAAQASLVAQLSRSAMVSVMAFIFAALIGAGGLWGWMLITHRIMPAGVVAMADPLRGGDLLIVPTGGRVVSPGQCPGGICLIYKQGSIPSIP